MSKARHGLPSWADWQELPGWSAAASAPAFERELREVSVLCGDEGARQVRRALVRADADGLRAALLMIEQTANALGAALLKDLCVRLRDMSDAGLLSAAADCADLIMELVTGLRRGPSVAGH